MLQEQVQHLSEDQRIGADSKDMQLMASKEHDEILRSSVSSDNVRAFHVGEGHVLLTATKTTESFASVAS